MNNTKIKNELASVVKKLIRRGYCEKTLAINFQTSVATIYNWKTKKSVPNNYTREGLKKMLELDVEKQKCKQ